jgi:hypothetical protein
MSELYSCQWVINAFDPSTLCNAVQSAEKLGGKIRTQDPVNKTDQGLYFVTLYIQTPSREVLDEFVHQGGAELGLTDWQPVSETEHKFWNRAVPIWCGERFRNAIKTFAEFNQRQIEKQH